MNLVDVRDLAHATLCYRQKLELDSHQSVDDQPTVMTRCNYLKGHEDGHSWESPGAAERQARRKRMRRARGGNR